MTAAISNGLLTRLAGSAVHHGFDAACVLFLRGEGGFVGAACGGHEATDFLFDVDGGHEFASFQCSVFRDEEEVPSDQ